MSIPSLKPVKRAAKGHNRFCGPAALSIIAGIDTAEAAAVLLPTVVADEVEAMDVALTSGRMRPFVAINDEGKLVVCSLGIFGVQLRYPVPSMPVVQQSVRRLAHSGPCYRLETKIYRLGS